MPLSSQPATHQPRHLWLIHLADTDTTRPVFLGGWNCKRGLKEPVSWKHCYGITLNFSILFFVPLTLDTKFNLIFFRVEIHPRPLDRVAISLLVHCVYWATHLVRFCFAGVAGTCRTIFKAGHECPEKRQTFESSREIHELSIHFEGFIRTVQQNSHALT